MPTERNRPSALFYHEWLQQNPLLWNAVLRGAHVLIQPPKVCTAEL
jgi:hypothetical protein